MNGRRDHDAEDLAVDHLLQQELGQRRPPDLASRIASADPGERLAAAARVDAAAQLVIERPRRRWPWLAAAALGIAAGSVWWSTGAAWPSTPSVVPTAALHGQALLDAFHAAMPRSPIELRDAHRRAAAAERALPVIRDLLAMHAADANETLLGARAIEFEIYAAELGDRRVRDELQARADRGESDADAALRIVALATAADDDARTAALAEVVARMPGTRNVASLVRGLETAELSKAEAERIAPTIDDPLLRSLLLRSAELAAASPRRLLGTPLEIVGHRVDDRAFSSSAWKGRVVAVCFWATWCRPSQEAMATLRTLRERHPELEGIAISCDHDPKALRGQLAEHGDGGFVHLFDRSRPGWHELATACGVRALPTVLWLDRRGIVREVTAGEDLAATAQRLLGR